MSTVIETYGKYEAYLISERQIKAATMRKVNLSLTYFAELYGNTETKKLNATDMHTFFHWVKEKKSRKSKKDEKKKIGNAHLNKIMSQVKAYTKWLSDRELLKNLQPGDVPTCKVTEHRISYLSKEELSMIFNQLEKEIEIANERGYRRDIYSAYLRRAIVRLLYTAGLRNFELRGLKEENLKISELYGSIVGKGSKPGIITFSEKAATCLIEYMGIRENFFPEDQFNFIFTLFEKGIAKGLTEQKLNLGLKRIAAKAGIQQNIYVHLFRHTLATHLLQDGRSIVDVRDKLRHSNISVTSIYAHSNPEIVKQKSKSLGNDLLSINNMSMASDNSIFWLMHYMLLHLTVNNSQDLIIKTETLSDCSKDLK